METPITISGSFQYALEEIRSDILEFQRLGCVVLSPRMFISHKNDHGFVVLDSDGERRPAAIHGRHLISMKQSRLLWVRNPKGYIGLSTALEIGYARALGIPIFASDKPTDSNLAKFFKVVSSPEKAIQMFRANKLKTDDKRALQVSVSYMSHECGFDHETDDEILSLLDSEIRELKEAVYEGRIELEEPHSIAEELADCMIYLYHFANQNGIDLNKAVRRKILANIERWGKKVESA